MYALWTNDDEGGLSEASKMEITLNDTAHDKFNNKKSWHSCKLCIHFCVHLYIGLHTKEASSQNPP